MKALIMSASVAVLLTAGIVHAQPQGPSGPGAVTGDPASSSADPSKAPTTTGSAVKPSRSGSGTSTSGGSDANGDQGRDAMPQTANSPKIPLDKQNKPAVGR